MNETHDNTVKIIEVRVSNFRSLENIRVNLDDLTVLVGANNSGKTSFLDALNMAIGIGRKTLGKEDIYIAKEVTHVPKDRSAIIDVLIRPVGENGKIIDKFPEGSFWTDRWGDGLSQDDEFHDFAGIRTTLSWNPMSGEYRLERKFFERMENRL